MRISSGLPLVRSGLTTLLAVAFAVVLLVVAVAVLPPSFAPRRMFATAGMQSGAERGSHDPAAGSGWSGSPAGRVLHLASTPDQSPTVGP